MEEIENEEWKDIIGYEGLYQVSNLGRIKSLGNGKSGNSKERILKLKLTKDGRIQAHLHKDGKATYYFVHRLVAIAFIPIPENLRHIPIEKLQINHLDENPQNDWVENLEWCDGKYNCNYGTRNERIASKLSKILLNRKDKNKIVLQYDLFGNLLREWESTHECERNGYDHSAIAKCCNGKYKNHKGYLWKYK